MRGWNVRSLVRATGRTLGKFWLSGLVLGLTCSPTWAQFTSPESFSAQSNGNFGGTIPVRLPPATGGLSPSLAISYSSHSPNGLLGLGFSLQGLSSITRCGQTAAQDGIRGSVNYNASDRFCLDGQRLIMVSSGTYGSDGMEYRTELDSFSQIISHGSTGNGPTYFTVRTKSGLTEIFGNTPDSGVLALGLPSIRVWAVSNVMDAANNFYTVSYTDDTTNGAYYPHVINYTANTTASPNIAAQNSVTFTWASRTDPIYGWTAGAAVAVVQRLISIQVVAQTQNVRLYTLNYDNGAAGGVSRLISVQECAGNGGSNPCLPPIPITWNPTGNQSGTFTAYSGYSMPAGISCGYTPNPATVPGNFGVSGRTDVLCNQSNGQRMVFLSNGDGTFHSQGAWPTSGSFCGTPFYGDINGDGKLDLACQYINKIWVASSNGDGTFSGPTSWPTTGTFCAAPGIAYALDIDGDGRADILCDLNGSYQVALSNGDGSFTIPATAMWNGGGTWCDSTYLKTADFNGDGKTDLLCANTGSGVYNVALSNGDGSFQAEANWPTSSTWCKGGIITLGDFNGDGKTDMLCSNSSGSPQSVAFSTGNGAFSIVSAAAIPGNASWCASTNVLFTADFNGDGKTDLVCMPVSTSPGTYSIAFSRGDGTFTTPTVPWNNNGGGGGGWCYSLAANFGNLSGSGQADLLCNAGGALYVAAAVGGPDVVTSVGNGMGAVVNAAYLPLTNASLYTKDTGINAAVYPVQDTVGPYYVVSSVSRSNGIGGLLTTNYAYGGLKVDLTGRGSLGFRTVSSTDAQTSILSSTIYDQMFPFTGLPATATTTLSGQGNGGTLKSVVSTYQCVNPANGSACTTAIGNRYFPALQTSTVSSYDLNGAVLPTSTTTISYDTAYTFFGNVKTVTTSNSDGYSKTTTNTYNAPDLTHWWLGQVNETQVTSTTP